MCVTLCLHVCIAYLYLDHLGWFFVSDFRGGFGGGQGLPGKNGSISGTACPRGLYGIFCEVNEQ